MHRLFRLRPATALIAVLVLACALPQRGFAEPAAAGSATTSVTSAASPSTSAQSSDLDRRLVAQGLARGAPVLIRIFKEESELELWMLKGDRYKRFATYPVCRWRGVLGPKLVEGDRQSPEGFYSFGQDQLLWQGHWFRAFNINFPNTLDRALGRSGSGILVHGACSSIGCYAMTDPVIDEIFDLVVASFAAGQTRIQVHIFPFHMTLANLSKHEGSQWSGFWRDLKPASDLFVSTQVPPKIGVCFGRYVVKPGQAGATGTDKIAEWCGTSSWHGSADRLPGWQEARLAEAAPPPETASARPPSARVLLYARLAREGKIPKPQPLPAHPATFGPSPEIASAAQTQGAAGGTLASLPESERAALLGKRNTVTVSQTSGGGGDAASGGGFSCNPSLPACRHFIALNSSRTIATRKSKTKLAKR